MGVFNRTSLTSKLLTYLFLIGLFPLLLFGATSIYSTTLIMKDQTLDFHKQFVDQRKQYIELVMEDVQSLIANLSGIDDITSALQQTSSDSEYDRLLTQTKIGEILNGYSNLKNLISIDVFTTNGSHFHVGETLNSCNINNQLLQRLYTEAASTKSFVYWSGIEKSINNESQFKQSIICAKYITEKETTNDGNDGIIVVSYNPEVFVQDFNRNQEKGEYSIIVDSQNRIVFHPNANYIGKTISQSIASRFRSPQGSINMKVDGKSTLIVYGKTLAGGWTIASFIPMNSIYAQSIRTVGLLSSIIFLCIILTIWMGYRFSRQVVVPIREITETFRQLQQGEIENQTKLHIKSDNEINQLAKLFNSFIDARKDITIQKKLEKELNEQKSELEKALEQLKETQMHMLQQEKLAGIGQLAAGVAHEINNPLGFVSSNCDTMNKYIQKYEKVLSLIEELKENTMTDVDQCRSNLKQLWVENKIDRIRADTASLISDSREGIDRITKIVNGLKSFSRMSTIDEKVMVNLNDEIKTDLVLANNEIKYSSDVRFLPGDIPDIYANAGQINQVIVNILVNAVHAIKDNPTIDRGLITIKTYSYEGYVYCAIKDNGCGMSEETRQKIFEPFFTTKPVGKGTGLGMSIAYDIIVNKHAGRLTIESELGVGSEITLIFPILPNQLIEDN